MGPQIPTSPAHPDWSVYEASPTPEPPMGAQNARLASHTRQERVKPLPRRFWHLGNWASPDWVLCLFRLPPCRFHHRLLLASSHRRCIRGS